jgi:predicted RNase H-like HicB family nuclease
MPAPKPPRVILKRDGKWWSATMPSFPGAYGQGRTPRAAMRSLASAVHDLIETYAMLQHGEKYGAGVATMAFESFKVKSGKSFKVAKPGKAAAVKRAARHHAA